MGPSTDLPRVPSSDNPGVQGKNISGQQQKRETAMCYVLTIPTSTMGLWGGLQRVKWRIDAECRSRIKKRVLMFVFGSHYPNLSSLYLATEWLSLWKDKIKKQNKEDPQLP